MNPSRKRTIYELCGTIFLVSSMGYAELFTQISSGVCGPDYHIHCTHVSQGKGRIADCLYDLGPELTEECRVWLDANTLRGGQAQETHRDLATFGVNPQGMELAKEKSTPVQKETKRFSWTDHYMKMFNFGVPKNGVVEEGKPKR